MPVQLRSILLASALLTLSACSKPADDSGTSGTRSPQPSDGGTAPESAVKPDGELTAKDIRKIAEQSSVSISVNTSIVKASGTGFFVGKGLMVTNKHVMDMVGRDLANATCTRYITGQLGDMYRPTRIIAEDVEHDISLVEVHPANLSGYDEKLADVTPVKLVDMSVRKPESGDKVYTFGGPKGFAATFSDGIISALRNQKDIDHKMATLDPAVPAIGSEPDYYQITAPISPGNSGGPCFNAYGEVIGVNSFYFEGGQNLNFAVSVKFLPPLIAKAAP